MLEFCVIYNKMYCTVIYELQYLGCLSVILQIRDVQYLTMVMSSICVNIQLRRIRIWCGPLWYDSRHIRVRYSTGIFFLPILRQ